jgi:hypothetical protein
MVPRLQAAAAFVFDQAPPAPSSHRLRRCARRDRARAFHDPLKGSAGSRVHDPVRPRTQTSPRVWWRNRMNVGSASGKAMRTILSTLQSPVRSLRSSITDGRFGGYCQ